MAESLHILILEDRPTDAELMQFELQEAGLSFTAKVVTTEEDYVRELLECSFDLILSDYDLPKYNGSLALTEARNRCPDTPFVLVSGAVTEDRAIEVLTQGAKDYVLKNRLEQRLAPAVRRALAEAEEHRARKQAEAELREAYRTLKKKDKIRTAERKAESDARKKMEGALREREAQDTAHNTELRRRAQEHMKMIKAASCPSELEADTQKLLHELQIYQIELEMQNEELIRCKEETDTLMADYLDIFDFAPIGYFTLNPEGVILRVNLTGAAILGVVRSHLINRQLRLHLSDESCSFFETFLKKTFEGKAIESCEFKLLNRERQSRFVQLEARLSEDKMKCHLAMIDITDRRQIEAKLEERTRQLEDLNKELESFSYSVSHDLRAPLRAINGHSRIILRRGKDEFDEDIWDKFQVIRSNAQKMNQLIEDLLSFAHLARLEPSVSNVDMQNLFQEAWEEQQRINPDRVMTLKIDNLPQCKADRNLMTQVCINILSNAVKFTKLRESALIEAGGYVKGDECVYFVKDNGAGFDMVYHDKLFGVFQRLHDSSEFEGTGIGLALVKRIINRHGGRIWAEGKVGKGATFYFTLPSRQECGP